MKSRFVPVFSFLLHTIRFRGGPRSPRVKTVFSPDGREIKRLERRILQIPLSRQRFAGLLLAVGLLLALVLVPAADAERKSAASDGLTRKPMTVSATPSAHGGGVLPGLGALRDWYAEILRQFGLLSSNLSQTTVSRTQNSDHRDSMNIYDPGGMSRAKYPMCTLDQQSGTRTEL